MEERLSGRERDRIEQRLLSRGEEINSFVSRSCEI